MKIKEGDHVELKGRLMRGYAGTIVHKGPFGLIRIRFDEGQLRGGSNMMTIGKANIVKKSVQHASS